MTPRLFGNKYLEGRVGSVEEIHTILQGSDSKLDTSCKVQDKTLKAFLIGKRVVPESFRTKI